MLALEFLAVRILGNWELLLIRAAFVNCRPIGNCLNLHCGRSSVEVFLHNNACTVPLIVTVACNLISVTKCSNSETHC